MYIDPTYILVIIGVIITMVASSKMNNTYSKYAKVQSSAGMNGAQVAKRILEANGIYGVVVQEISGDLTDHYDPSKKVVNLSRGVYEGTSIAAIGVAAHECGHAIQDSVEYFPLRLRHALVPVANFGSKLAWPMIIIGLLFGGLIGTDISNIIINIGLVAYSFGVIFQLVTLPVEYNASSRAKEQLYNLGIVSSEEKIGVGKVLSAAALTYVASASAGLLQLLRVFLLTGGKNRRK